MTLKETLSQQLAVRRWIPVYMERSTMSSSSDRIAQSGDGLPAVASFSVHGIEYVVVKSSANAGNWLLLARWKSMGRNLPSAVVLTFLRDAMHLPHFRRANWKSPAASRQVTRLRRSLKGCASVITRCACTLGVFTPSLVYTSRLNSHLGSVQTMDGNGSIVRRQHL